MSSTRLISLLAVLALVVAACQAAPAATPTPEAPAPAPPTPEAPAPATPEPATPEPTPDAGTDWPDELVIGFVPSREAAALVETIQPISDYLTERLGIPVQGFVSTDYPGLVTAMETGQAHIGAFGPFAMLQAVDRAGAEVILQSERFGSPTYHTQFFTNDPDKYCTTSPPVENERTTGANPGTFLNCNGTERGPEDSPIGPIGVEALTVVTPGTTVAFVQEVSASGYIFPATVFAVAGTHPDDLDRLFAGAHDAAVIAVCEDQAEIGVSFDDARPEATTGCDVNGTVVVFAYGPEIPNDGIVVDGSLPEDLKLEIQRALIDYSESEEGSEVLQEVYNITRLTEPNLDALQIVRDAARELGIE
jgi:phosphonate transport system substrate-binding protein